jgi:hypothetical protein
MQNLLGASAVRPLMGLVDQALRRAAESVTQATSAPSPAASESHTQPSYGQLPIPGIPPGATPDPTAIAAAVLQAQTKLGMNPSATVSPSTPKGELLFSPCFQCYTSLSFYANLLAELHIVCSKVSFFLSFTWSFWLSYLSAL